MVSVQIAPFWFFWMLFRMLMITIKLLAYLRKRKDIEIAKVETRYMKNRDKGIGIKVTVRKLHV